eukprot:1049412-Pleurochrysis_carterae.AAC.1
MGGASWGLAYAPGRWPKNREHFIPDTPIGLADPFTPYGLFLKPKIVIRYLFGYYPGYIPYARFTCVAAAAVAVLKTSTHSQNYCEQLR